MESVDRKGERQSSAFKDRRHLPTVYQIPLEFVLLDYTVNTILSQSECRKGDLFNTTNYISSTNSQPHVETYESRVILASAK